MTNKVRNIDQFNSFFHQKTLHPLISIADLSKAEFEFFEPTDLDMYGVILLDDDFGTLYKNGSQVNYKAHNIFTFKPGQIVSVKLRPNTRPKGWMLAFRADLLEKSGLGRDFYMFNFFHKDISAALELCETERATILNCFANIYSELHTPKDHLTDHMLRLGIGHLLSYCKRFYERQFEVTKHQNTTMVQRLDTILDTYLSSGLPEQKGQPTVAWCAEQFHLSPNYFGDVIKRELNITAQEYIQRKMINAAKAMLRDPRLSVTEIAESLGFTYPNHFTRLFHKKVGISPSEFRKTL